MFVQIVVAGSVGGVAISGRVVDAESAGLVLVARLILVMRPNLLFASLVASIELFIERKLRIIPRWRWK